MKRSSLHTVECKMSSLFLPEQSTAFCISIYRLLRYLHKTKIQFTACINSTYLHVYFNFQDTVNYSAGPKRYYQNSAFISTLLTPSVFIAQLRTRVRIRVQYQLVSIDSVFSQLANSLSFSFRDTHRRSRGQEKEKSHLSEIINFKYEMLEKESCSKLTLLSR